VFETVELLLAETGSEVVDVTEAVLLIGPQLVTFTVALALNNIDWLNVMVPIVVWLLTGQVFQMDPPSSEYWALLSPNGIMSVTVIPLASLGPRFLTSTFHSIN